MSYARRMIITDKHVRCIITIFRAPFPFFVYILTACGAPVVQLCIHVPVYLLFLRWLPAIDIYILPVRSNQVNGRRTSVIITFYTECTQSHWYWRTMWWWKRLSISQINILLINIHIHTVSAVQRLNDQSKVWKNLQIYSRPSVLQPIASETVRPSDREMGFITLIIGIKTPLLSVRYGRLFDYFGKFVLV